MDNKSNLRGDWVMPDDLAKKGSEVLYKKHLSLENELEDPLDELARDIALTEAIQDNLIFPFPPLN